SFSLRNRSGIGTSLAVCNPAAGIRDRAIPELAGASAGEHDDHARTAAHRGTPLLNLRVSASAAHLPGGPIAGRNGNPWPLSAGEKGVRHLLPERPGGCWAQKVPDPFFACRHLLPERPGGCCAHKVPDPFFACSHLLPFRGSGI